MTVVLDKTHRQHLYSLRIKPEGSHWLHAKGIESRYVSLVLLVQSVIYGDDLGVLSPHAR